MRKETERQIFHLVLGTLLASIILFLGKSYSLVLLGTLLVVGIFISELLQKGIKVQPFYWFIRRLEREKVRPGQGTLTFVLGSFIALVFFESNVVFLSVLILAFADSFSTLVGKGIGTIKIYNGKTLEGFFGGFLASLFIVIPYLNMPAAFVSCLAASLTELLSPVDDNIVIPPLSSLIIYIMTL
jgi:dolichol kinase